MIPLATRCAELVARIKEWEQDDKQGYDVAIELLCEAEEHLTACLIWERGYQGICEVAASNLIRAEKAEEALAAARRELDSFTKARSVEAPPR